MTLLQRYLAYHSLIILIITCLLSLITTAIPQFLIAAIAIALFHIYLITLGKKETIFLRNHQVNYLIFYICIYIVNLFIISLLKQLF